MRTGTILTVETHIQCSVSDPESVGSLDTERIRIEDPDPGRLILTKQEKVKKCFYVFKLFVIFEGLEALL
jgi:hypothetical protein